jgi:large subunit ribosomal protein L1
MKKGSKRYKDIKSKITREHHTLDEALKICCESSTAKFDESLELHLHLGINPKKSDQQIRGTTELPHGTGKSQRVAVFTETKEEEAQKAQADLVGGTDLIEKIKETEKTDFDIAIASPEMMPKLGKIARILGTRGLMPNPKTDTVTMEVGKAVQSIKKGKVNFKSDNTGNLHQIFGKKSFDQAKLKENLEALIAAVKKTKPASIKGDFIKKAYLSSTMGPSIKLGVK